VDYLARRAEVVTHDTEQAGLVSGALRKRLDSWSGRRAAVKTGRLGYEAGTEITGLLHSPDDGTWTLWSAPWSLREVEPEVVLQLDQADWNLADDPPGTTTGRPGQRRQRREVGNLERPG